MRIGVVTRVESQDREGGEARRPKRPIPPQQNTLTKGGKQLGSSSSECGWAQQSNRNLNARGLGWGVDALRRWKGVGYRHPDCARSVHRDGQCNAKVSIAASMIRLTSCAKAHGVAKNQELVATASVKCANWSSNSC